MQIFILNLNFTLQLVVGEDSIPKPKLVNKFDKSKDSSNNIYNDKEDTIYTGNNNMIF